MVRLSALVLSLLGVASAFVPSAFVVPSRFESSFVMRATSDKSVPVVDLDGMNYKLRDPLQEINNYLVRKKVYVRETVGGTVLVSGAAEHDADIFEMLHQEEGGFHFHEIIAFSSDAKSAKKRLMSRRARYSGLLNKLDFMEPENEGVELVTPAQIAARNISSWVAVVHENHLETLDRIYNICSECIDKHKGTLKNVAVLLVNAFGLDPDACAAMDDKFRTLSDVLYDQSMELEERFAQGPIEHTIIAVGKPEDYSEAKYTYKRATFGEKGLSLATNVTISRTLAARFITNGLLLDSTASKSFYFAETKSNSPSLPEVRLIRAMRSMAFGHQEEMDEVIEGAIEKYSQDVNKFILEPENQPSKEGKQWWEEKDFVQYDETKEEKEARQAAFAKECDERLIGKRGMEIRDVARWWAHREYNKRFFAKKLEGRTYKEFMSYIDIRSIKEARKIYGVLMGEIPDDDGEFRPSPLLGKQKEYGENYTIYDMLVAEDRQDTQKLLVELGEFDEDYDFDADHSQDDDDDFYDDEFDGYYDDDEDDDEDDDDEFDKIGEKKREY